MNKNVLRGIQLLDKKVPDWRQRIDKETLDLADGCNCVLGQLFGSYTKGTFELDIFGPNYGFNTFGYFDIDNEDEMIEEYSELTGLWLEKLGEQS